MLIGQLPTSTQSNITSSHRNTKSNMKRLYYKSQHRNTLRVCNSQKNRNTSHSGSHRNMTYNSRIANHCRALTKRMRVIYNVELVLRSLARQRPNYCLSTSPTVHSTWQLKRFNCHHQRQSARKVHLFQRIMSILNLFWWPLLQLRGQAHAVPFQHNKCNLSCLSSKLNGAPPIPVMTLRSRNRE